MPNGNKLLMRRLFKGLMNQRDIDLIDQMFASDFVGHDTSGGTFTAPDFKQSVREVLDAFPDCAITIEDQLEDGDKVATRWTGRGHHHGVFLGIPPTGKSIAISGISIDRIANEMIVESWEITDDAGLMRQLGLIQESAVAAD